MSHTNLLVGAAGSLTAQKGGLTAPGTKVSCVRNLIEAVLFAEHTDNVELARAFPCQTASRPAPSNFAACVTRIRQAKAVSLTWPTQSGSLLDGDQPPPPTATSVQSLGPVFPSPALGRHIATWFLAYGVPP